MAPRPSTASDAASGSGPGFGVGTASAQGARQYPHLSHCPKSSNISTRTTPPLPVVVPVADVASLSSESPPLIDLSEQDDTKAILNPLLSNNGDDSDTKNSKAAGKGVGAQLTTMDSHAFQSVNDRRNKLMNDRVAMSLLPHNQLTRPGQTPGTHRSLTSANWRDSQAEEFSQPPRMVYNDILDFSAPQHLPTPSLRTVQYPAPTLEHNQFLGHVAPIVSPIADLQLDDSFAYCYDRGNGQYTRLIPADMLPPLHGIPTVQQGCAGMVVLPQPRGVSPNGHSSSTDQVALRGSPATTTPTSPADTIQSRIDNIVAATPTTPSHSSSTGHHGAGPSSSSGSQRRVKIYCDKWVHEGVCAFTQQGCKYKHEMPSDKLTQHQLGLFHGYPQWWKKHQADLGRQRDVVAQPELPSSGGLSNDMRSNNERYLSRTQTTVGSGGTRGGSQALCSDTGGQSSWQRGREYSGQQRAPRPPPPVIGRTTPSRTMSGSSKNAITSPRLTPYGSPFGPIAPPARGLLGGVSSELVRSASGAPSNMDLHPASK